MLYILKCNNIPKAAAFILQSAQNCHANLPGFKIISCTDSGVTIAGLESVISLARLKRTNNFF